MEIVQPKLRFPEFKGDWSNHTLEELTVKIGDGLHGTPLYVENSDVYFINGNNLIDGKIVINENSKKVSLETLKKNNKGLDENSILISINGTIGSISRYNDEKIMLGKSVGYFNFKQSKDFYFQILQSKKIQDYFISELTGSTIKNLSLKTLRETTIFQPSLSEQTRIANFLSSVDEKLNLLKEKKALLEDYKKGIMQKIFNQEIRFKDDNGEDFGEWDNVNLQFISSNYYQGINTAADKTKYYSEGYPILQAKHITSEKISYEDSKFVNQVDYDLYKLKYKPNINEILISNIGTIGKVLLINENVDFLIAWNIFKVTLKPQITNALYITYNLKYISGLGYFDECKTGNATKFVNKSDMLNTPIYLPCLEEQTKIANFLLAIDEKIALVATQVADTQEYKKGLLQQMFV